MRTRIDMASCAAWPRSPSSIARSDSVKCMNLEPRPCTLTIMRVMKSRSALTFIVLLLLVHLSSAAGAQRGGRGGDSGEITVLKPARVFDGETMHEGWAVRIRGNRIDAAGP